MHPNKLYYLVGQDQTVSKNQALVWAGGDPNKIYFYQDDRYWDQQSWTVEPEQSFQVLCIQRCQQLRQQYDWICLWLSAGYDSMTILESFVQANIPIDEISYLYRKDYYDDPEIPYIESTIQNYKRYHNSKVTINPVVIDFNYTMAMYKRLGDGMIYHKGQNHKLSKSSPTFYHHYHDKLLAHKNNTPRSRADIYGKEKPRLDLKDGWWYGISVDTMWREDLDCPVEYFYISDQLPALHLKQCHMVASWMESIPGLDHTMVHEIQSCDVAHYRNWNLACGRINVACPQSRHGLVKKDYTFNLTSPDGIKIYNHLATNDVMMLNSLMDRHCQLKKTIGHDLATIMGKAWQMRPFSSATTQHRTITQVDQ